MVLPAVYSTLVVIEIRFIMDEVGSVGYIIIHIFILIYLWYLYMKSKKG